MLGDNGAGKSTLIKILAGVHRHDEGHFLMEGRQVTFHSPREAKAAGIATVYQDLAMAPLMSVWRNFWLGSEPTTWLGTIDMQEGQGRRRRGAGQDGHRGPRPGTAGRHAVGWRAPVGGNRPGRVLRRQGADPRRADGRPRRQAVGRRAALHRRRSRPRPRGDLHHPQPAPRVSRSATASSSSSVVRAWATSPRTRSPATSSSS